MNEFMKAQRTKILLAGKNPDDSLFWKKMLSTSKDEDLEFIPIEKLSEMDRHSGEKAPDLILLDLSRPGDDALQVFLTVHNAIPSVPMLVITGREDPDLAFRLLSEGAQDCLVKDKLNAEAVNRITHFVLARQKSIQQLQAFSLIDELTGLYNRRGFLVLAEQQLKLANRTGQSLLLAFVDVDGLKTINDLFGHQRGDLALIETAHILKEAFRETDILARLGGDEFVALLICGEDIGAETLTRKFQATMEEHNSYGKSGFRLSASIGIALSDPGSNFSISELMERADKLMYQQKKSGKRLSVSYQLRFLKLAPIGSWLSSTAAMLNAMIPEAAWPAPPPFSGGKVKKIKKALAEGLLTYLTRRSLCGTETVCDLGCSPALENKNPDRFEACAILGPVDQYLVEGVWGLKEMSEILAGAALKDLRVEDSLSLKIRNLLQDALAAHLYENTHCHRVPLCEHSQLVNLKWELQHSGRPSSKPWKGPLLGAGELEASQIESQNLESFFEKHHEAWERMMGEKLQSTFPEYGNRPSQQRWFLRKKKIGELIQVLKNFLTAK